MQIQPFSEVSQTLIDEINAHGTLRIYKKGEPCINETLEHFYLIIKGRMKVYEMNIETGREQTYYLLSRGDMFDVVTLLDDHPHEVMTEAIDTLHVIELPMKKARQWLQSNMAFNQLILPYIAKQVRTLENLSASLSLYDTSERLMRLIIDNLDTTTMQPTLLNNLSNSEIAKMVGSVRQVIERNLKALNDEEILESGRKQLRVKNLDRLKQRVMKLLLP